jgi:lysozyme
MYRLTRRVAMELISHEAIVLEAYRDSVGVWTWGVGITNSSGHQVHPRYLDNPQTVERCLEVYIWALNIRYIPRVYETFLGRDLTEGQFCAALSFHFNTGRLHTASWPKLWREGRVSDARRSFMQWRHPPEILARRQKECDLFFDSQWSNEGTARLVPVRKPSYTPNFSQIRRVDVSDELGRLLES